MKHTNTLFIISLFISLLTFFETIESYSQMTVRATPTKEALIAPFEVKVPDAVFIQGLLEEMIHLILEEKSTTHPSAEREAFNSRWNNTSSSAIPEHELKNGVESFLTDLLNSDAPLPTDANFTQEKMMLAYVILFNLTHEGAKEQNGNPKIVLTRDNFQKLYLIALLIAEKHIIYHTYPPELKRSTRVQSSPEAETLIRNIAILEARSNYQSQQCSQKITLQEITASEKAHFAASLSIINEKKASLQALQQFQSSNVLQRNFIKELQNQITDEESHVVNRVRMQRLRAFNSTLESIYADRNRLKQLPVETFQPSSPTSVNLYRLDQSNDPIVREKISKMEKQYERHLDSLGVPTSKEAKSLEFAFLLLDQNSLTFDAIKKRIETSHFINKLFTYLETEMIKALNQNGQNEHDYTWVRSLE